MKTTKNTEVKFYPLYAFPGYTINVEGELKDPNGTLLEPKLMYNQLYYQIVDGRWYGAAELVWNTFVGELNASIKYSNGDPRVINMRNLYVDLEIEKVSSDKYYINGIMHKVIPGFSAYVISKQGTVFSLKRNQFICRSFNYANYPTVALVDDNGFRSPKKVHRLVYSTFIGELKPGLVIDHIDGNKQNPAVTNLRQISNRENVCRSYGMDESWKMDNFEEYAECEYTENEIRSVCMMLRNNMSHDSILAILKRDNNRREYNSIVSLCTRLKRREIFPEIADEYKVPEKITFINATGAHPSRFSLSDIDFIIKEFLYGRPQQRLATLYGCKQSAISVLLKRNMEKIGEEGSTTIERIS